METNEIYRAAMDTFGEAKQTIKLSEEIGEFLAAFCQYSEGRDKLSHVAEEMADVHNMLDQWAVHLGCVNEVERMKRYKLRRLEQRIEEARKTFSEMERGLRINTPLTFEELEDMIGEPVGDRQRFHTGPVRRVHGVPPQAGGGAAMKKLIGTFLPIMTNADRIRAMSDEELAQAIYQGISSDPCDYCKENDHHCTGHTCQGKADAEVILEWLQRPVEQAQGNG